MNILYDYQAIENRNRPECSFYSGITKELGTIGDDLHIKMPTEYKAGGSFLDKFRNDSVMNKAANNVLKTGHELHILHLTGLEPGYSLSGKLYRNAKKVITVFNMFPENGFSEVPETRKRLFEAADGIVFTSKAVAGEFFFEYINIEKPLVIIKPGFLDAFPNKCNGPNGKFILYPADRTKAMNYALVIDAFSIFHEANPEFGLVCMGGEKFTESELRRIKAIGLEGFVMQIDADDGQMAWLYQNASAMLYIPLCSDIGMSVINAMHFACPMVLSAIGSNEEIAGDNALYIKTSDPEDLADKMRIAVHETEGIKQMVRKAKAKSEEYTWKSAAISLKSFYQNLL